MDASRPGYSLSPSYRYPLSYISGLARSILTRSQRSFRADARVCVRGIHPQPDFAGLENIPHAGPVLLTMNHYARRGFHVWWLVMAVTACLPREPHWITTAELTFRNRWYAGIASPVSRVFLRRLAQVYDFSTMPPMPPRPQDVLQRAAAVRKVLARVDGQEDALVCLAPEGGDSPAGRLSWPPVGAGRFMLLLAERGLPILPCAGWEQHGRLHVHFGPTFNLQIPARLSADEKDHRAAGLVMRRIAALLPDAWKGDFACES